MLHREILENYQEKQHVDKVKPRLNIPVFTVAPFCHLVYFMAQDNRECATRLLFRHDHKGAYGIAPIVQ